MAYLSATVFFPADIIYFLAVSVNSVRPYYIIRSFVLGIFFSFS